MIFGRTTELATIDAALAAAGESLGSLLALVGEPGIGKTRLADEATVRARERGFRTAWGRTWEGAGAPAGWPWTQVIRELVESGVELTRSDRADLSPLLPDVAAPDVTPAGFATLDAVLRFVRRATRTTPALVVLDDIHAADRMTLLALQLIARSLRDLSLVVVVTFREAEVRLRTDAGAFEPILREGARLQLARLGEQDSAALFQGAAASTASARAIHRITEGNPLFVLEVARLVANGRVGASLDGITPADGIRAVLDGHVALLSPESRRVLAIAALLGRELVRDDLVAIVGSDADRVETVLGEAIDAGVLVHTRNGVAFSHVLLAETLAASLPPSERARIHGAIAQWWRSRSLGDRNLSEIAHHMLEAGGNPVEAIGVAKRAATQAIQRLAFDRAADLYERALARVADVPDGERVAIELLVGRGEALGRSGAAVESRALCSEAAQRSRAIGAADLEARAALASARQFNFYDPDRTVVGLLERALELAGRDDLRARLLAALSYTSFPSHVPLLSLERAQEAIKIARRLGDSSVLLLVLYDAGPSALSVAWRATELETLGTELAALARTHDDMAALLRGESFEMVGRLMRGDRVDVDHRMRALDQLLHASVPSQERSVLHLMRAMHARHVGRFDEADACMEDAIAGGLPEEAQRLRALHAWGLAYTRGSRLDLETARAIGEMRLPPGGSVWVAAALGDDVRSHLDITFTGDLGWPPMIAAWADACVLAAHRKTAEVFYPLLLPAAGEMILFGPAASLGPADRILAGLALLRGDPQAAASHYERALTLCERAGALPFYARTLAEYGRFLADRDHDRSTCLLTRARDLAATLGMDHLTASLTNVPASTAVVSELRTRVDRGERLLAFGSSEVRLKESKGLAYLARLVESPGREIHVLDLVASAEVGDAGPVIDVAARRQYERRLEDLEEELREAEAFGDHERASRAQGEIDALADELARAVGLGGRERRAGSLTERARINVQRRLKDVIVRIEKAAPRLGRYLKSTIRTGTYCAYLPLDPW